MNPTAPRSEEQTGRTRAVVTKAKIALVQMRSTCDPMENLRCIAQASAEAAAEGAAMVFLPEMAVLLDKDRARSQRWMTREADSAWCAEFANLAEAHRLWIHSGSLPFLQDAPELYTQTSKRVNRSLLFSDTGEIVARYDKIHLFDVDLPSGESWRESALYCGGESVVSAATPIGRLGLSICFDLRFPELYRALVGQGATAIAVPAAFTVPSGRAHWHSLLRARAIESGVYIVAAAQCGHHADGRRSYGHSLVIDPWGQVLVDLQADIDKTGYRIGYADIDSAAVDKARQAIPLDKARTMRRIHI